MENKEYQRIIDYICQEITDDRLKIGDRLPTERLLSEQMGVSRNCVREALRSMGRPQRLLPMFCLFIKGYF